jgi:hypothetical protein
MKPVSLPVCPGRCLSGHAVFTATPLPFALDRRVGPGDDNVEEVASFPFLSLPDLIRQSRASSAPP